MKIEANGLHTLKTQGKSSAIYVYGDAGGGTATLGHVYEGTLVPLKDEQGNDVTLSAGYQYTINHGQSMNLVIELTGATSPALVVKVKAVN